MPFSHKRVVFEEAHKLDWLPLKDTPGFGGVDIPGVECKFFGKEGEGPWFYLVKHDPGVVVHRHKHTGDVFHYILEGEWTIGTRQWGPGFMQYEERDLFYGPITSGPEGSLFLAVYDNVPSFIEPEGEEKHYVPDREYDAA
jgi:hypothetical protein